MSYTLQYLREAAQILQRLDTSAIDRMISLLVNLREQGGRLFLLGVGGSAANAAHAVNDFRKIARIEAYSPSDNVAELTARINDDGWEHAYADWLHTSRLSERDMIFVLSVGGGDRSRNISTNIVRALEYARDVDATICGIVGRDGGYTARVADAFVLVPTVNTESITPHAESFQTVIWHLIVSHPALRAGALKWESTQQRTAA
ncbi:MAG: SIS domain-containing protein [Gemmataceae bacterium]|nr:SIS domain-containing protein [Gemmataceae bacterium]